MFLLAMYWPVFLLGTPSRASSACMLVPVYSAHFPQLAVRINRTYALARGVPPTTVLIFDDEGSVASFCHAYHRACAVPSVVRLTLKQMIGNSSYIYARGYALATI